MDAATEMVSTLDWAFWGTVAAIIVLLMISAFFSGSETALTAARRGRLHSLADKGSTGAKRALKLTENSERLIGAVLLGNNLVNILAAALATSLFTRLFGDSGVALATLVMTLLVLVFAEVLPKTYAISHSERAAEQVAAPITLIVMVFSPIVATIQTIVQAILRLMNVLPDAENGTAEMQEELAGAISLGHSAGAVHKEDKNRLLGALDLGEREVEEIMLHRSQIEMIDASNNPEDIIDQCLRSAHTRLPIYENDAENILGVVHAKDLLRAVNKLNRKPGGLVKNISQFNVLDVAMKPYFVPETTPLDDQMREFLRRRSHFALVVDEYGALQGLITLEDILEEIVGEIADEHDVDEMDMAKLDADGNMLIDGGATIRDINRDHDWSLPDEEANTIAGLVIHEAQLIPTPGQVFSFYGFRIEIIGREQNRITKLKMRPL